MTPNPLIERTSSRGTVTLSFPGLEASFPATNRSIMLIIISFLVAITIILPTCFYEIFSATPESLESVGTIFGARKPEKIPIQTDNGIEIIEACPPCPTYPSLEESSPPSTPTMTNR